ncbi:Protein O-linked-mannose beta-1,2-N-acetylglucosaminyltransferase 1 [Portunus trituberculatus]|uniref:Protein O-linked-mannose beta-1,2-N-acetylglucosaminyltransferase 1 n=1 Tax=Portunus trituberculatus TaxID=210409 RepID=A0A5B7EF19_PORTR|nr:Protein O-linked-mannose beta-1,2-N-acetylglucosaminyltransferase 1 [Portunus trituberculatus]
MKIAWRGAPGILVALLPLLVICSLLAPLTAAAPDVAEGQKAWEYLATQGDTCGSISTTTTSLSVPLQVDVHVSTENVTVLMNGVQVYHVAGGARQGKSHFQPHSGVHLLVTGPRGVMMQQRFLTYQPAEHVDLAAALAAIQPHRVVVLAAVPEFSLFLGQAGAKALDSLGFRWCSRMAWGEPWVGVAVTGRGMVAEAAATLQVGLTSPKSLRLSTVTQLESRGSECSWYRESGREVHAAFCRQYEGYGDLCACRRPFTPHVRHQQARMRMKEEIPVVVVTANKPRHLYR